jgi:carboxypeptidase C (cathepsin A)
MSVRSFAIGLALSCLAVAPAVAQQRPTARPGAPGAPGATSATQNQQPAQGVEPVEHVSTTNHTITIGGKTIAYTAHAGTMII